MRETPRRPEFSVEGEQAELSTRGSVRVVPLKSPRAAASSTNSQSSANYVW